MTQLVSIPMVDPMAPFGPGAIIGLMPSAITGTNTTAALTVLPGAAVDSTNSRLMALSSPYSWSVISDYQGGTMLPNSMTIHFFLCNGSSGTRVWAHTGLVPTPPVGFNSWYRRIFSFPTDGAGALIVISATEVDGGSVVCYLPTIIPDVATTTLGTARSLYTLTVPNGIKVQPLFRAHTMVTAASIILASPDEGDMAPGTNGSSSPGLDISGSVNATGFWSTPQLTTNTTRQIAARGSTAGCSLYVYTRGWRDWRR